MRRFRPIHLNGRSRRTKLPAMLRRTLISVACLGFALSCSKSEGGTSSPGAAPPPATPQAVPAPQPVSPAPQLGEKVEPVANVQPQVAVKEPAKAPTPPPVVKQQPPAVVPAKKTANLVPNVTPQPIPKAVTDARRTRRLGGAAATPAKEEVGPPSLRVVHSCNLQGEVEPCG